MEAPAIALLFTTYGTVYYWIEERWWTAAVLPYRFTPKSFRILVPELEGEQR